MRINAIIATHGRPILLRRTLASLAQANRPAGFEHIYIAENGSDAGARRICQDMADQLPLRYEHTDNPGKARVLQSIINRLGDGLVIFLDDDIRVCKEIFERYAAAATTHGPNAFFGGPLKIDYADVPPPQWLVQYLPHSARGWHLDDPDNPPSYLRFLGANYGSFVETINQIGGFNLSLGPGALTGGSAGNPMGEETDLQTRLLEHGVKQVYIPDADVWHYVPKDRCTPRFTLHRFYRRAWTKGLMEPAPPTGRLLLGVPRWMWRKAIALKAQALLANFKRDPAKRFKAKIDYCKYLGYLRGLAMQRTNKK